MRISQPLSFNYNIQPCLVTLFQKPILSPTSCDDQPFIYFLILKFPKAKKQETKEAFEQWNTDGDDKFLTFKEFDAGMQSVGITQERF